MPAKKKPVEEVKKPFIVRDMAHLILTLEQYNDVPLFFELTKSPKYDEYEEAYDHPIVNEICGIKIELNKETGEPIRVVIRL